MTTVTFDNVGGFVEIETGYIVLKAGFTLEDFHEDLMTDDFVAEESAQLDLFGPQSFKVGDKVSYVGSDPDLKGKTGVVTFEDGDYWVEVKWNDFTVGWGEGLSFWGVAVHAIKHII